MVANDRPSLPHPAPAPADPATSSRAFLLPDPLRPHAPQGVHGQAARRQAARTEAGPPMTAPAPFNRDTRTRRSAARYTTLHIRVSEAMAAAVAKAAADDQRTRHNFMRKVLADHVVERGYITRADVGPVWQRHGKRGDA